MSAIKTCSEQQSVSGAPREIKTLLVLFFFSGFPALIYQLVWQRALFRILGVNIESVTITVTAFMLGLGLGSLAGGLLSEKKRYSPLLILAAIESLTGLFGHFSMDIFEKVGNLVLGQSLPATAVVTLALVLIPTLLMGATLPLLVAHLVRRGTNVGNSVGQLYYVNTLGAGAVCMLAALVLFPFLGMQKSIDVAVALNCAVALCALLAFFRKRQFPISHVYDSGEMPSVSSAMLGTAQMLGLAFFGGFVSLSYEIFFFRTVSYASGSSSFDFTFTLAAFLIGLASGARLAAENCRNTTDVARDTLRCLLIASVVGFAFLPVLAHVGFMGAGGDIAVAALMIYVIARFWGRLLPNLAYLGIAPDGRAGLRTAWLYLANIFGASLGSIITGFILMDRLKLVSIAQVLIISGLACAALLALFLRFPRNERLKRGAQAAVLAVLTLLLLPMLTSHLLESMLWKGTHESLLPFVEVVENRSGIITVDEKSAVYGGGAYDGVFNTSLLTDTNGVLRPYALSYYNPAPHHVLEIGLSTGSWAQIIANNPDVEDLTIVEINPGYLKLIGKRPEVSSLLGNPKVNIVIDDGRRWLRLHPEKTFDAIISNTTYNFRANTTNLLSVEFLDLIKKHLNPGGTFFYNTTDSERVQRTGCTLFSYGARFLNHMIVSMQPLVLDAQRWKKSLAAETIDGHPVLDLSRDEDRAFFNKLDGIAEATYVSHGKLLEACPEILARTTGLQLITDDNMGTEWRHQFRME